jgi:tyrosine-protein kinase
LVAPIEPKSLLSAHEFLADGVRGFDETWVGRKRTVVFTPADRGQRCTTIAAQHAWLVACAGERVILLDGDPRGSAVARATGVQPTAGSERMPRGNNSGPGTLVPVEVSGVHMSVLSVRSPGAGAGMAMPRGQALIADLLREADALIIDAPPLSESAQALMLARSANGVIIVARLGETRLDELRELGELLASHGVQGAGIVLVAERTRRLSRRRLVGAKEGPAVPTDGAPTDGATARRSRHRPERTPPPTARTR